MINQEVGVIRLELTKQGGDVETIRLDLKTRIQLTAAFIYGTADPSDMTVEKAVSIAGEIEDASEQLVRRIKQNNPTYVENYNRNRNNRSNNNGRS